MLNLRQMFVRSIPPIASPSIPLGDAYLCEDCSVIMQPNRGACCQCGSRQVMPVEAFIRRVKQQIHTRIEKRRAADNRATAQQGGNP